MMKCPIKGTGSGTTPHNIWVLIFQDAVYVLNQHLTYGAGYPIAGMHNAHVAESRNDYKICPRDQLEEFLPPIST